MPSSRCLNLNLSIGLQKYKKDLMLKQIKIKNLTTNFTNLPNAPSNLQNPRSKK